MRRAWPEFKALHANTIEFPVYWDSIEPVEGKFDFSGFDADRARPAPAEPARHSAVVRHLEERGYGLHAGLG